MAASRMKFNRRFDGRFNEKFTQNFRNVFIIKLTEFYQFQCSGA